MQKQSMLIREATEKDYAAIVDIQNKQKLSWPERAGTVEALKQGDARRNPRFAYNRWIAEIDQQTVGFCSYAQISPYNQHTTFYINVAVREKYRNQGIGTALCKMMFNELNKYPDAIICADAFDIYPGGLNFLAKFGIKETWRETPVELDVSKCDTAILKSILQKLADENIEIKTIAELSSDPERNRKMYDIYTTLSVQVPGEEGYVYSKPDYHDWLAGQIDDPSILHDAYLIVLHEGKYVGLKEVGMELNSQAIQCGLMAVLPEYQRKGIAYAMQLKTIEYAKGINCRMLKSCTATSNLPMQNLYAKLGYKKVYEWIQCMRMF